MRAADTYCFILNTASGNHRAEEAFARYAELIREQFPGCDIIYIREEDSIPDVARKQAKEHTYVIACGGDGTVHQVVNGLHGSEAILGVLPFGSGNDFARTIGLSSDTSQNLSILKQNKVKPLDLISANGDVFINTYGIGADGLTNYYASESRFQWGALRYFLGGMRALLNSSVFHSKIKFDEHNETINSMAWMVCIANGTTEGGRYTISPNSKPDDGVFEVIVVRDVARLRLIWEFVKLSLGISFSPRVVNLYTVRKGCKVTLSEPQKTHADGEQKIPQETYRFDIKPAARHTICNI